MFQLDNHIITDEYNILFLGYQIFIENKQKVNSMVWVHPLNMRRPSEGKFNYQKKNKVPEEIL